MSAPLQRAVAQKKEAIEAAMEMFERGAEVLASAVGELLPLCTAAAPVLRLALDNVQSKEVFYVREQFLTVRGRLDVLSGQLEDIDGELRRSGLDARYFGVEENVRNQFRKYMDILEAQPQYQAVKTRLFLEHFARTGGEKNLHVLHEAVMGLSGFGESVLDVVERYVSRNRRLLEDFCVRLKELFCLGLIALLGHCALTQEEEQEEQDTIQDWSRRVEQMESRMKAAIEGCVAAFPQQAQTDAERLLKERPEQQELPDTAQALQAFLAGKYDWVSWSVRIINHAGSSFRKWRAGEHFHHVAGRNWFEVLQANDINLVVSYSEGGGPREVPRDLIQQLMEGPGRKGNAQAVAEVLGKQLGGFVVHAVSRHKESTAAWSFPEEAHYWVRHKNVAVCVHPE